MAYPTLGLRNHWSSATVEELVAAYWSSLGNVIGDDSEDGTKIVKLSDDAIIKCKVYASTVDSQTETIANCKAHALQTEAINQRIARQLINPELVRIPSVYRSFLHQGHSYIVMEYIRGRRPSTDDMPTVIPKLVRLLDHMATITGYSMGPLGGGFSHGTMWEFEDVEFEDVQDMEDYWNSRLITPKDVTPKVSLRSHRLVLCHLDIAPRNILLLDDGSMCLLDWESAGFYPRFFEYNAQWISWTADRDFSELLLKSMKQMTKEEEVQAKSVSIAWGNSLRYTL